MAGLFTLARLDFRPPETEAEGALESPVQTGLVWLFERFTLPGLPSDAPRQNEEIPKRATLPRPVDLSPAQPGQLPTPSAAFPDFASIKDTRARKRRFFEFMAPLVQAENIQVQEQRLQILRLHEGVQKGQVLSDYDKAWLRNLCTEYRLSTDELSLDALFQQLLMRVDMVPPELALAQAAIESAWGQSRFAYCGNNLFGEWCFTPDCGIVPAARPQGQTYEVAAFLTPIRAVRSYIQNLNAHPAYRQFRVLRYEKRLAGERPDGHTLALGLQKYAEIGMDYVVKIRAVIRQNKRLMSISGFSELALKHQPVGRAGLLHSLPANQAAGTCNRQTSLLSGSA